MELNEQDKERIIAEEKLRMETRKEFFKENFGGMHHGPGGWGSPWRMGWHGRCGGGFGFIKGILLALFIVGICHLWHHPYCGGYPGYYGYPYPAPQSAPMPQPPVKN